MPSFIPGFIAGPLARWGLIIAFFAVLIGAGFAAGVAWEHRGPPATVTVFGKKIPLSLFGTSLKAQRDAARAEIPVAYARGAAAQREAWLPKFTPWKDALAECRAERREARDQAAAALSEREAFASAEIRRAYRLGRASCPGATDAESRPSPDPVSPDGVRVQPEAGSFLDLFGAAGAPR
jgi:hypothetical protein